MAKTTTSYVCQECGYESPAYLGKCPECSAWNTLKEFKIQNSKFKIQEGTVREERKDITPRTLDKIAFKSSARIQTGFSELDTVLGGGIVKGSVILLAGDPGIGKSTLLLQLGLNLAARAGKPAFTVLYISGEESEEQVGLRAQRIYKGKANGFLLLSLNDTDAVVETISATKPDLVIIDSIQTMEAQEAGGLSGSVSQVRYATSSFVKTAKTLHIPTILVGHVTKEGMVAGPMVLSHMVDTLLFFEGEKTTNTRILRSLKNRFGPVDEVGVFAMSAEGIEEIKNPHELFMGNMQKPTAGSILTATMEGSRTFLVELQALTVFSKMPIPRRVSAGTDPKRLELLLAVLQKHAGVPVGGLDVFVNVAGGLKISDTASDLGICLAIFSSFKDMSLSQTIAISEVGLLGELRSVPQLEKRMKEAKRLGFKNIISVKTHKTLKDVIQSLSS